MSPAPDHEPVAGTAAPIVDADVIEADEVAEAGSGADPQGGTETVQGVPVLAEVRQLQPSAPASLPTVQAAAMAATGFVAGAATLALVRRHSARKRNRGRSGPPRRGSEALTIIGTRSFLVDVHLIAKPD